MIDGLDPYPHYKLSGQQWLGEVPEHWLLKPNRAMFREVKERNRPNEPMLSVTIGRGVVSQQDLLSGTIKKDSSNTDKSAYKVVRVGDLAYNKMRAWQGALGASSLQGIVSPAYVVMRCEPGANPWFYHHLYRTPGFAKEAERWSYGITSDMWSLRPEHFRVIGSIQPPEDEQKSIVRFLDYLNHKVGSFVLAKRKLIACLNEQRQAIIHRAVTRGVDSSFQHKESAIPWVGEVPKHWQILRAKYLFREVDERSQSGSEELLSVSHLTGVTPRSEKNITMFKAASYVGHKICRPGDLAINTMWAWMGALGVAHQEGIISPAYAVYRVRGGHRMLGTYVEMLLRTRAYTSNFRCRSTGVRASRLRLYPEEFFRMPVLVPPIDEQTRIIDFINGETSSLSTAIARIEREIALMQEYRTRLTADIVTGKLDVREAASKLPDLTSEGNPVGDAGLVDEETLDPENEDSDE